jgi:NAD-dependent dihydropyrimidine dehydrogenase PreA subunit
LHRHLRLCAPHLGTTEIGSATLDANGVATLTPNLTAGVDYKIAEGDSTAAAVSQVYINPDECIDCGNCASICAQNAIFTLEELPADKAHFAEMNRMYFN